MCLSMRSRGPSPQLKALCPVQCLKPFLSREIPNSSLLEVFGAPRSGRPVELCRGPGPEAVWLLSQKAGPVPPTYLPCPSLPSAFGGLILWCSPIALWEPGMPGPEEPWAACTKLPQDRWGTGLQEAVTCLLVLVSPKDRLNLKACSKRSACTGGHTDPWFPTPLTGSACQWGHRGAGAWPCLSRPPAPHGCNDTSQSCLRMKLEETMAIKVLCELRGATQLLVTTEIINLGPWAGDRVWMGGLLAHPAARQWNRS